MFFRGSILIIYNIKTIGIVFNCSVSVCFNQTSMSTVVMVPINATIVNRRMRCSWST